MYKIIIFIFFMLNACLASAQAQTVTPDQVPQVIETYNANQARFVNNYRGKIFDGQVTLASVVENPVFKNNFTVQFDVGGQEVDCPDITDKHVIKKIINWNKGQQITVIGSIEDVTFGDLELSNCKLATQTPKN